MKGNIVMKKLRAIIALVLVLSFLSAFYVPMETSAATSTKFSAMLARAEALCNYEWTPTSRIYTWNGNKYNGKTYFEKGETVKGVPYTLFFYDFGFDSLLSLEQYKAVASKNYSTTAYAEAVGANRTGPVYGNCCATFVSEVFGGSFMNGSNPRYDSVYKIKNATSYGTTTTGVKLANVKAGDALSNTSGGHIIWVGAKTSTTITIYESTPPVCKKTVLNIASNTDSNGYLYYAGGTYSIRTRSNEIVYDDSGDSGDTGTTSAKEVYSDYVPIKAYPCASANFDVQDSDFSTTIGTIYTTDLCTIDAIYDNGWCKVTYPTTSSTKTAYTKLSNFVQNTSYTAVKHSLDSSLTTYQTKALSTTFGSSKNFYVVGVSGTSSQVFYKLDAGGYKLAWVATSSIPTEHTHSATGSWQSDSTQHYKLCSCGEKVNAASHDSGSWVVTKEAEIGVAGSKELRCTVCAYVLQTATIAALADPNEGNLAYQKTYTTSGIYSDSSGNIPYPDENGTSLTDGKSADASALYNDEMFVGFNTNTDAYETDGYASITVDLGATSDIAEFVVLLAGENETNVAAGVKLPTTVEFYVSNDKSAWTKAGTAAPVASSSEAAATLSLSSAVSGRYIQYRIISATSWMLVSEVRAFGDSHTHAAQGSWQSDSAQHYKLCSCGTKVNAASHDSGTWVVTKEAEIGVAGSKELRCTVCAYVLETATIAALVDPNEGNIAYQKTYTADGIYSDASGNIPYPDENGSSLTDGASADASALYKDTAFVGFNKSSDFYEENGYAAITVDLGSEYSIKKLSAFFAAENESNVSAGVKAPSSVDFYVSRDNSVWTKIGTAAPIATDDETAATLSLSAAAIGRYVQYRIVTDDYWMLVSEVRAFGTAYTAPIDDSLTYQKTYTANGIYSDSAGTVTYPDENGVSLTDGIVASANANYNDAALVGFNKNTDFYEANGYVSIIVDLGASYSFDEFAVYFAPASEYNIIAGVSAPTSVEIYVSADNTNWTKAGSTIPTVTDVDVVATVKPDSTSVGRYIEYRITTDRAWIMVSEVLAYGSEYVEEESYLLGDLNLNGEHDSSDYLLLKRAHFDTFDLDEKLTKIADINRDGKVEIADYLLLKRICFGTYTIQ